MDPIVTAPARGRNPNPLVNHRPIRFMSARQLPHDPRQKRQGEACLAPTAHAKPCGSLKGVLSQNLDRHPAARTGRILLAGRAGEAIINGVVGVRSGISIRNRRALRQWIVQETRIAEQERPISSGRLWHHPGLL